jgi:hypothetical protein
MVALIHSSGPWYLVILPILLIAVRLFSRQGRARRGPFGGPAGRAGGPNGLGFQRQNEDFQSPGATVLPPGHESLEFTVHFKDGREPITYQTSAEPEYRAGWVILHEVSRDGKPTRDWPYLASEVTVESGRQSS